MGRIIRLILVGLLFLVVFITGKHFLSAQTEDINNAKNTIIPIQSVNNNGEEESVNIPEVSETLYEFTTSAWIPYWDTQRGVDRIQESSDKITSVSPVWFYINSDGTLTRRLSIDKMKSYQNEIKRTGVEIIPTITNASAEELSAVLNSDELLSTHISAIMKYATDYEFDGIDIDYESIKAVDKDVFSEKFLKRLFAQLHEQNKKLTIAVLPKTDNFIYKFSESRNAQDWEAIGKYVDEFRIMGYDWMHNSTTDAGPVSPIPWLNEILEYAITKVDKGKIILGLPLYGYYWKEDGVTATTFDDIDNIKRGALESGVEEESKEPYIKTSIGEVWYQDAASINERVKLAQDFNIRGVVFWRLGGEDPDIWKQ